MAMWKRRVRGVLGMGVAWAILWGLVGGFIEFLNNVAPGLRWTYSVDMWIQTLMLPGFLGGVLFSGLLWAAAGHRRFDQLSLVQFLGLGALVGVLLGTAAAVAGAKLLIFAPLIALSTGAGACSLALARLAERRALVTGGTLDHDA